MSQENVEIVPGVVDAFWTGLEPGKPVRLGGG